MSLAKKIQDGNMKDEKTIRDVVNEISTMTGREVSKEKEDKIVNTIISDIISIKIIINIYVNPEIFLDFFNLILLILNYMKKTIKLVLII